MLATLRRALRRQPRRCRRVRPPQQSRQCWTAMPILTLFQKSSLLPKKCHGLRSSSSTKLKSQCKVIFWIVLKSFEFVRFVADISIRFLVNQEISWTPQLLWINVWWWIWLFSKFNFNQSIAAGNKTRVMIGGSETTSSSIQSVTTSVSSTNIASPTATSPEQVKATPTITGLRNCIKLICVCLKKKRQK